MTVTALPGRRILIIDDNPTIHHDFRKILQPAHNDSTLRELEASFFGIPVEATPIVSLQLDSAHQGEEGLELVQTAKAESRPYAMAFVDMRMPPGWDGLTTIEHLWMADPKLQIVICTAYSDNSWQTICDRLGYTDSLFILKKPFDNIEVCQLALALTEKWQVSQRACLQQQKLERIVEEQTKTIREHEVSIRQKQKLEAIGSLAGGVAHEFNNLLQVISGYSQFVMRDLPHEHQAREDLAHVVDATNRAAAITKQLLCFSRKEPGKMAIQKIDDVLMSTIEMLRPVIGEGITLEVDLRSDTALVKMDPNTLSQAVLNLCINARDAMRQGGTLYLSTAPVELGDRRGTGKKERRPDLPPGKYVAVTIKDTGCGMTEDVRERMFEPFFTTKDVGSGTGMGLAMVFGAVQDHQGAIEVQSEPDVGTTVVVFIPCSNEAVDAPCIGMDLPTEEGAEVADGVRILVAEDDPLIRRMSVRVLREAGYDVVAANNGQEAIEIANGHESRIDLCVLDMIMPLASGKDVWEIARRRWPCAKVVFCTGSDSLNCSDDTSMHDAASMIHKPIDPDVLLRTVRNSLRTRRMSGPRLSGDMQYPHACVG